MTMETRTPKAVIAGGGLAGLSAAKRLVDRGWQVELVEAEPQLGGRTASWTDADGLGVESGVHTFFGAYDHLIRLLNEVGVDDDRMVAWDDQVAFLRPGGAISFFATDPMRDLLRVVTLDAISNNDYINPLEKLGIAFTFGRGLAQRDEYEPYTVERLAQGDSPLDRRTYERLFRPLARGLHFCEPEELSAYPLLTLLFHGITNPWNLRAGTFRGGMTEVMINPIAQWLQARGAVTRTKAPVSAVRYDDTTRRITGFELEGGEVLTGDVYISALPLEVFQPMIPQALYDTAYFTRIAQLETVPALAVQLWFDRTITRRDEFVFLSGSPMTVFQDESRGTFPYRGSRISAQMTDRTIDGYDDAQLIERAVRELHTYLPASRQAQVQKSVVVRHHAIALKPGAEALRPKQASPIANFFLAGDYTRQNWFTTMEGACRSGEMAANAITNRTGYGLAVDDAPGAIPPTPRSTPRRRIAPARPTVDYRM